MILCDQLARNIWRGTKEAYAYEAITKDISRELAIALVSSAPTIPEMPTLGPSVDGLDHGEVYPPYLAFILVALMHSETIEDHDLCDELFQLAIETTQPHLHVYFEGEQKVAREHRVVLEAFGRYPYRNAVLGRKTTPEEAAWLAKKENMPDWAKSQ
ncbi:Bacterial protein of unknown function (DUF924) [Seminavis robusta]|uniref:DUF924-domain-containing protein n=1 Tax=Seminavis robusta TaxID=568900 RepID=A0A9N8EXJ2_9STRA|nr:Bacterial protein of unknown function (DUF924) [Seminavis robusta]|eukprot:Sro1902_g304500.1 Bacterial protein of unknown function (DUF924) (157) ;mRNA; r:20396-20866